MEAVGALDFALLMASGLLLWASVVHIRPAVARARLRADATVLRNRIVDAILDGDIRRDDEAAMESLSFLHSMTHHAKEHGIAESLALVRALQRLGIDPEEFAEEEFDNRTYAAMTPKGRKIMMSVDREANRISARYMIHGSAFWWILSPAQFVWRHLVHPLFSTVEVPSPQKLAEESRAVSHELDVRSQNPFSLMTEIAESVQHRQSKGLLSL